MIIPKKEIEILLEYADPSPYRVQNAVYITPAQSMRDAADAIDRRESAYWKVKEWLKEVSSQEVTE